MSARDAIALRVAIQKLVQEVVPPPITTEKRQDRMFALVDAFTYEMADQLLEEMAGGFSEEYVTERLASFYAEMVVPFTLAAMKERGEGQPPVGRA